LLVDLVLRHRVIGATLADIDTLGIATAQLKNRRRHQAVVQHHVGLLHQAQGAEGQQVRITRPGAHQIHLTGGDVRLAINLGLQHARPRRPARPVAGRQSALEHVFPEPATLLHPGNRFLT
jgi:hypothetical protein